MQHTNATPGTTGLDALTAPGSGLAAPSREDWDGAAALLAAMPAYMENFLALWSRYMHVSGYLFFTTAKREDCIMSCRLLVEPILAHHRSGLLPTFERLRENADRWASPLVESGLRHWRRGINPVMFLGCFKTFLHALQDALDASFGSRDAGAAIPHARSVINLYGASFEIIWMEACFQTQLHEQNSTQEETNRLLTLEKCRFENVLNTISDGVLVIDGSCRVTTANTSMRRLAGAEVENRFIWEVLSLEASSCEEFFTYHPSNMAVEIAPFGEERIFQMHITPLGDVSLASAGEFLVFLTDITPQVRQREHLEEQVRKRTADLVAETRQLEEMNITLRNVLKNVNAERDRTLKETSEAIRRFLLPAVSRISRENDPEARLGYEKVMRGQIDRLLQNPENTGELLGMGQADGAPGGIANLTLSELKVCQLIQAGHSTKQIASILRISPETVQTHRKHIRRKLGLRGHNSQLAMHLLVHKL